MKRYLLDGGVGLLRPDSAQAKWNLLFPMGETKFRSDFPKGKATFDAAFLGTLVDNFKRMAARHKGDKFALQLNYLHPEHGEPVENHRAAGWIEDVKLEADGLYVLVRWTDEAREFISKDEFRYLSPEFSFDWQDSDTGKRQGPTLWGAALLNTPFLKELPRVAASEQSNQPEPSGPNKEAQMKKAICAALGMPEDSTDEAVVEKCAAMAKQCMAAAGHQCKAPEADVAKLTEVQGAVTKLATENAELTKRLSEFEAAKKTQDVKAFFDELIRHGKCTPSIREGMEKLALSNGLEAVKFLEAAAPMVKLGEVGIAGEPTPESPEAATKKLSAMADELQKKHGLSATEAMRAALRQDKALADKAALTTRAPVKQ